jgi:predicted transcriptional regulator
MTDDLAYRLREMADEYDSGHHESWPTIDAFNQAADRIEAQAAEIERLREALKPFAELGFPYAVEAMGGVE